MDTLNKIRGCLFGGAIGDALGYAIEFDSESTIFNRYGQDGIQDYTLSKATNKAYISDDTQMTLFTADGLLRYMTANKLESSRLSAADFVAYAYKDWYDTQKNYYGRHKFKKMQSKLLLVDELYANRAPGITCLKAISTLKDPLGDYIADIRNNSKGCGGIMRVAPVALVFRDQAVEKADYEAAQVSAITHCHSLGYMTSSVVAHIIHNLLNPEYEKVSLREIVMEARDAVAKLFEGDAFVGQMTDIINRALEYSLNDKKDLDNIHALGEGWIAEETLGIALYCALKYENDFTKAICVSVNHKGDSDSTGAVCGNILGAKLGMDGIEEKWLKDIELYDVIDGVAMDLYKGPMMTKEELEDKSWDKKYGF